jgi:hypothetical protein
MSGQNDKGKSGAQHSVAVLDDFNDASNWQVHATEGVAALISIVEVDDSGRKSLRLDYDFCGRAGYALIRKKVELKLPENYAISFGVRGQSPDNTLELKLVNEAQDTVWWVHRPSFKFPAATHELRNKARHFSYAWGPDKARLVDVRYIELCVTATAGGKGTVWFENLTFAELPAPADELPVSAKATSRRSARHSAQCAVDGNADTFWHSGRAEKQDLTLDFGANREFGGLVVDFGVEDFPRAYSVETRMDGSRKWAPLHAVENGKGGRAYILTSEAEGRYLRIKMRESSRGAGYVVRNVDVKPLAFGKGPSDFFMNVAADTRHGLYPRHLLGQQCYWTIAGVETDTKKALINEDALVETEKLGFTLEPFIYADPASDVEDPKDPAGGPTCVPPIGRLLTWKEGTHEQSLEDGYLPVPTVERKHVEPNGEGTGLALRTRIWALGKPGESVLFIGYELENTGRQAQSGQLMLAVRPFQVNPTWQFLNAPGGFSPIRSIKRQGNTVVVNDDKVVIECGVDDPARIKTASDIEGSGRFGATTLDAGDIGAHLAEGRLPEASEAADVNGFASGALAYNFDLPAGAVKKVVLAVPLHANYDKSLVGMKALNSRGEAVEYWRRRLARVNITLPPKALELELTYKAQAGYILLNRKGVGIQPGVRCYDRSWARDGALTSSALLQLGYNDEVRDFIKWFAQYQFDSGKIPCCVDHRGADPTPEHDSCGEFIYLVAEYYRYTGDKAMLCNMFQRVLRAVGYIESLLEQTRTSEFDKEENRHLRGLLPPSISHEGYSDKPAYSYWDDFWCLKGLRDAAFLAREFHGAEHKLTREFERIAERFRADFFASIEACQAKYGFDTIVGAADRGDKDACSTTIALDPGLLATELRGDLDRTFQEYWTFFYSRMAPYGKWDGYTPYETRGIGAFIRLGHRERAHKMLEFFMPHRRPQGWRHWAECVFNDPLKPAFIGDMPHTWVGSDFVRSVRSMIAYEREDGALVIGGGWRFDWMHHPGRTKIVDMPTEFGKISFSAYRSGYRLFIRIEGDVKNKVVLALPYWNHGVSINGRPGVLEIPVGHLPADIVVELA